MLRYYMAVRGDAPASGRSLFISMHGGGNAPAATNDEQWQNQISLVDGYNPKDALWVAPRAPGDDWNMWFTPDIEPLFERLITDLIVFEGIDPNKVYINGYSAGGDGVYQLGPRMADHWAGAAMSAGHPNDASPLNLRNIAFAIHVGGDDTAYDRNLKAAEWGMMLDDLAAADPGGYEHQWQVHAGLPHWMNLEDAVEIPFVQMYTRNPVPAKVVWHQANVIHSRFYWLAVDPSGVKQGSSDHRRVRGEHGHAQRRRRPAARHRAVQRCDDGPRSTGSHRVRRQGAVRGRGHAHDRGARSHARRARRPGADLRRRGRRGPAVKRARGLRAHTPPRAIEGTRACATE